jgi:predicted metal-dependent hydrolase
MPRSTYEEGAALFNEGRFFEAHEAWEQGWRKIPDPDRAQTQAAILVCGVFVLIGKGRLAPAARLASLALERFAEAAAQSELLGLRPVLEIPAAEDRLLRVLAALRVGETDAKVLGEYARDLRATVRKEAQR